jgi:hypothetical protein
MEWIQFAILLPIMVALLITNIERHKEMKDFHGRLCTLQQQYMDMMERVLRDKK